MQTNPLNPHSLTVNMKGLESKYIFGVISGNNGGKELVLGEIGHPWCGSEELHDSVSSKTNRPVELIRNGCLKSVLIRCSALFAFVGILNRIYCSDTQL
jgi:hypothetical protein